MVRQAPARDRMSPLWHIMAQRHCGHWTAGRTRRARRSLTVDDSQRGPSDSGTMHRLLLGHITNFREGSAARRQSCCFDIGPSVAVFLLSGPTPQKNWGKKIRIIGEQRLEDTSRTGREGVGKSFAREYARNTDNRTTYRSDVGSSDHLTSLTSCKGRRTLRTWHVRAGQECGFDIGRLLPRQLRGRGAPGVEVGSSAENVYGDTTGWYGITDRRGAGEHSTQRSRNRPKGTVRKTCWHFGAFHASLSANQGRTPGRSSNCRGHPRCTPRIRHRSRGTAQTTFWHFGALHVSLAGNRDRTLVNGSLSPLGNLSCNSGARTTYLLLDHRRHGTQSQMAMIGTHDAPLRGHVLVDGVVTFRPDDFDADVTKEEVKAKFFVPDEGMNTVAATVAMYGPFYGPSHTLLEANRLKATGHQQQIEFLLLVDVSLDDAPAATAKQRLGALNSTLITALQDIDGSDGRTCKVGASVTEFMCVTVDKNGVPATEGASIAVYRLKLKKENYLSCELVQASLRVLQQSGSTLLCCDKTVRGTWPKHNTSSGMNLVQRLLVPSTRSDQMVPIHVLQSEESVAVMRERLAAPLHKLGLTVDKAMVLYKDVLPGLKLGCTAFVFNANVVSYILLAEPGLGSIGKMLFKSQMGLIRPLVYSTKMELMEEGELPKDPVPDQLWPALPGTNQFAGMNLDLRHPLEGRPLLAPHLLDVLPFTAVFQCNSDRIGPGPVLAIAHFVAGDITDGMVTGHVISEIIAALSEQLHPNHEHLTFEFWGSRVGVQHVWHKGANTICRILIVVASGRQHQLIVDRFHGKFFPWDFTERQVIYFSYPDCMCIGCQSRRKREHGYGCVDCGSKGHLSKDVDCLHFQERVQASQLRRAEKPAKETSGAKSAAEEMAAVPASAAHGLSTSAAGATLLADASLGSGQSLDAAGSNVQGGKQGQGRGGAAGRGRGGRGAPRVEYNWLCGFCHKPNGNMFHNSKYCAKPFLLPPPSEISKMPCIFCNHDHFFLRCPILMENAAPILPNAYINMARELKYPVIEVHGKLTLNIVASLPRLLDAASSGQGTGESSASSQNGSDGGSAHGEIVLSGGGDLASIQQQFQQSMQLQLQQSMSTLGDKLMLELGRQLNERLSEVNESMKQMSKAHNQLQERVLEQTTTTTDLFTNLKEQVEECRRETKEAQEKGDRKLEEALKRMADAAKTIVGKSAKGGMGAGGAGVKDLAGTSRMEQ